MSLTQRLRARLRGFVAAATLADALMLGGLSVILLWHWVAATTLWRGSRAQGVGVLSLAQLEWWLLGTAPLLAVVLGAADRRRDPESAGMRTLVVVLAAVTGLLGLMAIIARTVVASTLEPAWNWRFVALVASLCVGVLALSAARAAVLTAQRTPRRCVGIAAVVVAGAVVDGAGWHVPGRALSGLGGIALGYWIGDRLDETTTRFDGTDRRLMWAVLVGGLTVAAVATGTGAYPLPLDGGTGWAGASALPGALFAIGALAVLISGASLLASPRSTRQPPRPSDIALVRTLAAARLAAWGWLAFAYLERWHDVDHPVPARWLLAATTAVSLLLAWLAWAHPSSAVGPPAVVGELVLALIVVAVDPWVFVSRAGQPAFWGLWPVVAILGVGITWGGWRGAAAGVAGGMARLTTLLASSRSATSTIPSTVVFFALAGAAVGYLAVLLRESEAEVATARVREELGLRLHDGVLQTLGIVRRRTDDPVIATLARDSERELRDYLFATTPSRKHTRLGDGLQTAANRFEQVFAVTTHVFVPDDLSEPPEEVVEGLLAATSEVLSNVGKHAGATNVFLFAEPTAEGVLVSIRDDGCGFDEDAVARAGDGDGGGGAGGGGADGGGGQGLRRSIRGRVLEIGGRVEIRSVAGHGTEVCMWVP